VKPSVYGARVVTAESRRLIDLVGPKCGTHKAYVAHKQAGEPIDRACRAAHKERGRRQRARYAAEVAARRQATAELLRRYDREFRVLYRSALHQELAERGWP